MNEHARYRRKYRILRAHIPCKPPHDHGLNKLNMRPDYSNSYPQDTVTLPYNHHPNKQEDCEANSHNTDDMYLTGFSHHHSETEDSIKESKPRNALLCR